MNTIKTPKAKKTTTRTAAKAAPVAAAATATAPKVGVVHDDKGLRLAALRDLKDVALRRMPDVRGWNVELRDGVIVGKVARILVDQHEQHLPRYLDLLIEPSRLGVTGEPWHALVPMGRAQVAKDRDVVFLPSITKDTVSVLPRLGDATIDFTFEMGVANAFGLGKPMANIDDLYRSELYNIAYFMMLRPVAS